jgi:hypothetical protein
MSSCDWFMGDVYLSKSDVEIQFPVLQNMYVWDSSRLNQNVYASNFVPLWCSIFSPGHTFFNPLVYSLLAKLLFFPSPLKDQGFMVLK